MKVFDKDKALKKLKIKQNKNTYIKRISISLSCLFLILVVMLFTFAKFESNSPDYTLIQGRVSGSTKDVDILAIYQGSEQVNEIPSKGSGWAFDRAECTNGATASWDNNNWNLILNFTSKTKCSIYFEEQQSNTQTITQIVAEEPTNTTDIINKGTGAGGCTYTLAYDGTDDNNLRYVGNNPCNYITYNNETWRIIGVMNNIETESGNTENLIKIIRSSSLGNYSWDSSLGVNGGYGVNEWSQADLMQELNNDYLGNITVGTNGKWYNGSGNVKSAPKPTSTISSASQNQIESVVWKLGSPNNDNGTYVDYQSGVFTTPYAYTHERANTNGKICSSATYCTDTVTRTSSWTGKVALIYPSDYGYATSGGSTTNRATCLGLGLYNGWSSSSYSYCKDNNWLKPASGYTWTLSPYAYTSRANLVFGVNSTGGITNNSANGANEVSPVVFLKSSISITGGDGSSTNPYVLG